MLGVQVFGDRLTHLLIAGIVHVAVQLQRVFLLGDVDDGLANLLRRCDAGVADAEIKDIFRAVYLGKAVALLKHGADDRAVLDKALHFLRDHKDSS